MCATGTLPCWQGSVRHNVSLHIHTVGRGRQRRHSALLAEVGMQLSGPPLAWLPLHPLLPLPMSSLRFMLAPQHLLCWGPQDRHVWTPYSVTSSFPGIIPCEGPSLLTIRCSALDACPLCRVCVCLALGIPAAARLTGRARCSRPQCANKLTARLESHVCTGLVMTAARAATSWTVGYHPGLRLSSFVVGEIGHGGHFAAYYR